jgi:hypothetical protein
MSESVHVILASCSASVEASDESWVWGVLVKANNSNDGIENVNVYAMKWRSAFLDSGFRMILDRGVVSVP